MEAWLAELEMEMDVGVLMNSNRVHPNNPYVHSDTMETTFDEQLAATLGEDFPYPLSAAESNTSSPQLADFDYANIIDHFSPPENYMLDDDNNNNNNNNSNNNNVASHSSSSVGGGREVETREAQLRPSPEGGGHNNGNNDQKSDKRGGGAKRKREPSQVQDHIMAERKRRELLSQRFIALSAIVPGLKKTDKTSVLGEAIKYLKQLQEKVKVLEEVATKRTVESVVVVKKSQLVVDDDDNDSSCTVDDTGGGAAAATATDTLPELEVKLSDNTLLFRLHCEKHKGVLPKFFSQIEKHDMSVVSSSVIPFGTLALDITVVAQMEKGFDKNVKELVRSIRSALILTG